MDETEDILFKEEKEKEEYYRKKEEEEKNPVLNNIFGDIKEQLKKLTIIK